MEYVADLEGVDHVGLGSDSTSRLRRDHILVHAKEVNEAYPSGTRMFIARFDNSVEKPHPASITHLDQIRARLLASGWYPADVEKVAGGGFLRACKEVWGS